MISYENTDGGARVTLASGERHEAGVVIAADGLHSLARKLLVDDEPVSSAYVAYRGTVPAEQPRVRSVDLSEVVVHVGPGCHFVHYGLRGGELLNQVAVFESPKALAGQEEWGTPDELDAAFAGTSDFVREGLPFMWRDKWWRMFDRDPIMNWVHGRIVLLGDSAHPPLQYIAQGAITAIEDGWVLGEHVARSCAEDGTVDWDAALAAYEAVRPEHCRRVLTTSRAWGELWHLDGVPREQRNALLRARHLRLLVRGLAVRPDRADTRRGAGDVHADPALLGVGRGSGGCRGRRRPVSDACLYAAVRTPFGRFGGALAGTPPTISPRPR